MNLEETSQVMEQRIAEMLEMMQVNAGVKVDVSEQGHKKYLEVVLNADNGAELIGHHGNRMKALSTVLNMITPETEERVSVLLDVNGYREQRTEMITKIANRAITDAIDSMSSVELDPMTPWERRIIHMVAVERTDIATESIGSDEDRRVIVRPVSIV